MFSIQEIFDLAIQIEKNGEKFYRGAMEKVANVSLESLLQWLADAEVEHSQRFTELKQTVKTDVVNGELETMSRALLQDILKGQTFSLDDIDLTQIPGVETLLQVAMEFEKDTILFFEMISGLIDDTETSEWLTKIIGEEEHHVKILQEFLDKEGDEFKPRD